MISKLIPALFTLAASCLASAQEFYLHSGDHVLFYGDSITDQRLYTQVIETFATTRYPDLAITYTHSGWGGDRVSGGGGGPIDIRLQRDLLSYKPSVVTLMLGMNDGNYKPATAVNDEQFFNGYRHIVESIRQGDPQARITVIEPSPFDNITRPTLSADTESYNQVLVGFGKWIANYAQADHLTLADGNTDFVAALRKADTLDPKIAETILPDHVHPSFGGAMLLAEAVLKSWHARSVVASLTLDASGSAPKLESSEHTHLSNLKMASGSLTWTATDDALPLPIPQWKTMWGGGPSIGLVLQSSDLVEALDRQPLRVTGLKNGNYKLTIDGREIGLYNDAQLAEGINLATLATPMSEQAMSVYNLITQHNDLHNARWRTVQVPLEPLHLSPTQSTMDALDTLDNAVAEQAHKAAQPKPHSFSLAAVN